MTVEKKDADLKVKMADAVKANMEALGKDALVAEETTVTETASDEEPSAREASDTVVVDISDERLIEMAEAAMRRKAEREAAEAAKIAAIEEEERVQREAVEAVQRKEREMTQKRNELRKSISKSIFEREGAATFHTDASHVISSLHHDDEETRKRADEYLSNFLMFSEIARESGFSISDIPMNSETLEKLSMAVAGRVQDKIEMYRPAGKEASQKFLAMSLQRDNDKVLHFTDNNGNIELTAYTFVGGDEEWVRLKLDPQVGSNYSFVEPDEKLGMRINYTKKAPQATAIEATYFTRWEKLDQFVMCDRVNFVNGYHPDMEKFDNRVSTDAVLKKNTNINAASNELFSQITNMATEDLQMAVKVCTAENINPQSLFSVMAANNWVLNQEKTKFIEAPIEKRQELPERPSQRAQPQQVPAPTQALESTFGDEMAGLLNFVKPGTL